MSRHRLKDGTSWPIPDGEVQWQLRYGNPDKKELLYAAQVMDTWAHVLDPTVEIEPVIKRIRELRRFVRTTRNAEGAS